MEGQGEAAPPGQAPPWRFDRVTGGARGFRRELEGLWAELQPRAPGAGPARPGPSVLDLELDVIQALRGRMEELTLAELEELVLHPLFQRLRTQDAAGHLTDALRHRGDEVRAADGERGTGWGPTGLVLADVHALDHAAVSRHAPAYAPAIARWATQMRARGESLEASGIQELVARQHWGAFRILLGCLPAPLLTPEALRRLEIGAPPGRTPLPPGASGAVQDLAARPDWTPAQRQHLIGVAMAWWGHPDRDGTMGAWRSVVMAALADPAWWQAASAQTLALARSANAAPQDLRALAGGRAESTGARKTQTAKAPAASPAETEDLIERLLRTSQLARRRRMDESPSATDRLAALSGSVLGRLRGASAEVWAHLVARAPQYLTHYVENPEFPPALALRGFRRAPGLPYAMAVAQNPVLVRDARVRAVLEQGAHAAGAVVACLVKTSSDPDEAARLWAGLTDHPRVACELLDYVPPGTRLPRARLAELLAQATAREDRIRVLRALHRLADAGPRPGPGTPAR